MINIKPVILAGGTGSRLWPLSRQMNPKQFLKLTDTKLSMLQSTVKRTESFGMMPPLLICNEQHRFLAAEQMRRLGLDNVQIILEPEGKNTAPAIALAALSMLSIDEDPLLLVLAADHLIEDVSAFHSSIKLAQPLAEAGKLVTFGIVATRPETGYGYIKKGALIGDNSYTVDGFAEKPDAASAQEYIDSKKYLWNSGMFLLRASVYIKELQRYSPNILESCQRSFNTSKTDINFIRVDSGAFSECPSDSIDYAVMEKTKHAAVVSLDAGWNDIGSWSALWDISAKDVEGNGTEGDIILKDSKNNLIRAESRLIAAVGVEDLIIVETKDAILVAHRNNVQDVKSIVEKIKSDHRREHIEHREVYRPWGVYDSVDNGERYQVKRITVTPGAKLSVQMHHHRAEHWIVVSGTAKVTNGDNTYLVTENQSTYIPVGQVHALENPGVIDLELIEVQSGSYLGEDDIVRFEDRYGRT